VHLIAPRCSKSASPSVREINLQKLASHTSGLPRLPWAIAKLALGKKNGLDNPYQSVSADDVFGYLAHAKVNSKAKKFKYSNFAYGLLGHLLEHVTQKDLEILAKEKVFTPLRMTNTGIEITQLRQAEMAQGYTAKGKETCLWTFGALAGCGAFNSNCQDMMKFAKASLTSSQLIGIREQELNLAWMQPGLIDRWRGDQNVIWHNGMVGGFSSYMAVDQDNETAVVVLSASARDTTNFGQRVLRLARQYN